MSAPIINVKSVKTAPSQLKYQRVEAEIRQLAGTLPVGAKLPAERALAQTHSCNFLTVRKALKQLVEDGTVVRRIGSGTFVARKNGSKKNPLFAQHGQVGLMLPRESNAYAYRILQAIAHAGLEQKVHTSSGWVRDFADDALRLAEQFKEDGCSAILLPWFPHQSSDEVGKFARRSPLPVSLPMPLPGLGNQCFVEAAAFGANSCTEDLCRYYRSLGQDRIAFIGPDSSNDIFLQKVLTAFVCFTSRENISGECGLVAPGAQAMDELAAKWKSHRGNLAIVSYDDEHALRFITAMHKAGCDAPEDFRIIGYNNTEASCYCDPPLSTVCQNYNHIGEWMLKSALALGKGQISQSSTEPKLQLLVRYTCGGRDHISDATRFKFTKMDVVLDHNGQPSDAMSAV